MEASPGFLCKAGVGHVLKGEIHPSEAATSLGEGTPRGVFMKSFKGLQGSSDVGSSTEKLLRKCDRSRDMKMEREG